MSNPLPAPAASPGTGPRRPAAARTFPALDAVRAAGAFMVLVTHCGFDTGRNFVGWQGAVLARLDLGVTLFFVLSGFLLSRPWFLAQVGGTPPPALPHYLWKRALRVLPVAWTAITLALVFTPGEHRVPLRDWIQELSLTQLFRSAPMHPGLTQMWSLSVEVAFYLSLPLLIRVVSPGRELRLARVVRRSVALGLVGLLWAAFAARIALGAHHSAQWLPGYLHWFLLGMVFAAVSASGRTRRLDRLASDLTGWWMLALALFAISCTDLAGPRALVLTTPWEAGLRSALYAAVAGCLLFPLFFGPERDGTARRFLASPVPSLLGKISYGVFCLHVLILNGVFTWFGISTFTGHFWFVTTVTAALSVVAASATYVLVERPLSRLRNHGPFARTAPAASTHAANANH